MPAVFWMIPIWPMAVLATWQTVETWHHGSIFESWRAYFQARNNFVAGLMLCPFCFSHWAAAAISLLSFTALHGFQESPSWSLLLLPVYILSVTRGSNFCNDATYTLNRTPKQSKAERAALEALDKLGSPLEAVRDMNEALSKFAQLAVMPPVPKEAPVSQVSDPNAALRAEIHQMLNEEPDGEENESERLNQARTRIFASEGARAGHISDEATKAFRQRGAGTGGDAGSRPVQIDP